MYYISRTQLLAFLAAVAGVYIVGSLCQAAVERSAAELDRDKRERIWQREARGLWFWRGPDTVGMALIILGFLRSLGFLTLLPSGWGVPVLAAGLVVLSLSSALRAWLRSRAYRAEAPGSAVARSAFRACLIVTATELALAGAVCWYVLSACSRTTTSAGTTPPPGGSKPGTAVTTPKETSGRQDPFWVDEAEALNLLKGKDAAYLAALVRRKDIRAAVKDGRTLYRRDDINAMKAAGLPSNQELQDDLKDK